MRILYFHQHFSTPLGSTGTRSYEFCQRLLARGHSVTMVCGSYKGGVTGLTGDYVKGQRRGMVDGIDVIELHLPYSNSDRFLKRAFIFIKFMMRATRIALTHPYDVVFATSTPLTVAVPGVLAKLLRRKKFIFEVRDLWPELPREMGVISNPLVLASMEVLESVAYRMADACVALAPGIADGIRRKVPKARIEVIPNGSDFVGQAEVQPLPSSLSGLLHQLSGKLICVFTGAHGIANGLEAVLDAAAELKRRKRSEIALLFVGEGMMKRTLIARAQREGLDNCIFLDPIPKLNLLSQVQVGLMILANVPAFYNGTSPNKFFDYLSVGLPVLINYPGWLAEFVRSEGCGVVVPPGEPNAFCDALEMLAKNHDERAAMGVRARALAERNFARDKLAAQFVTFLEEVGNG
jgi:glycosyltransferase involved in cell wall biosynthesis